MQRIMLATDFSERAGFALGRAVLLARETGAALELVHAGDADGAAERLEELARSPELAGLPVSTRNVPGDVLAGIVQAVEASAPDLLVIGGHGAGSLLDAFVGTIAERTIRAAPCPVLMVRSNPSGTYRSLMLTTDLSESSQAALQWFDRLGIGAGAVRAVLHVFDAPALRLAMSGVMPREDQDRYLGELHAEARQELDRFMAAVGGPEAQPILRFHKTPVAQIILATAAEAGSDLIVVATHCDGFVARNLLGSVTEQVLRDAPVDVLAVPPVR